MDRNARFCRYASATSSRGALLQEVCRGASKAGKLENLLAWGFRVAVADGFCILRAGRRWFSACHGRKDRWPNYLAFRRVAPQNRTRFLFPARPNTKASAACEHTVAPVGEGGQTTQWNRIGRLTLQRICGVIFVRAPRTWPPPPRPRINGVFEGR